MLRLRTGDMSYKGFLQAISLRKSLALTINVLIRKTPTFNIEP